MFLSFYISFLIGSEKSCSEIKDTVFQLDVPPNITLHLRVSTTEMSRPLTFPGSMLALPARKYMFYPKLTPHHPVLSAGCINHFAYRFLNGASLA